MKPLDWFRIRIAALFQRSEFNADLEEELRSHVEHRADDLERIGLSRAEAERGVPGEFCSGRCETNWYERSLEWQASASRAS